MELTSPFSFYRQILNAEEIKLVEEGWTDDPFLQKNIYLQSDG